MTKLNTTKIQEIELEPFKKLLLLDNDDIQTNL